MPACRGAGLSIDADVVRGSSDLVKPPARDPPHNGKACDQPQPNSHTWRQTTHPKNASQASRPVLVQLAKGRGYKRGRLQPADGESRLPGPRAKLERKGALSGQPGRGSITPLCKSREDTGPPCIAGPPAICPCDGSPRHYARAQPARGQGRGKRTPPKCGRDSVQGQQIPGCPDHGQLAGGPAVHSGPGSSLPLHSGVVDPLPGSPDSAPWHSSLAPGPVTRTSSTMCVLLNLLLGSVSVITVCGNLLILISIIYFKQLHTPTNYLILSLAVTDLLVGVVAFPVGMKFTISSCLYKYDVFCNVREIFDVTLSTASVLNLCCISIDRYFVVCQPLRYRTTITRNVVVIMILVIWSVSVLVAIGFIIAELDREQCGEKCNIDVLLANTVGPVFSFYLPLIIMVCIYVKIFLVAQKQARSIQNTTRKSGATVSKSERKATKTLAIVMGVFLICWTPFFLCFYFQLLNPVTVPLPLFEALIWLALSNSMLNPFIYAFFYSWFRSAFRMIICGKIFISDYKNTKLK
ncbi:trace amine-associated receptor 1-like [Aulostomus maculatus]